MYKKYLKKIAQTTAHDDHREESFYPSVANLMIDFANSINKKNISVTILPKKTEAGNPDFRIWNGENKIVGYIEAKIPDTNLNKTENSKQLKRYLETFPNVILTDFYEFRLYRHGEMIEKISIGRPYIAKKLKTQPPIENQHDFECLLQKFFDFSLPKISTAENLAHELAKRTRFLRDEIISVELAQNFTKNKNYIRGFYQAFQQFLISGLKEKEFADLYAQTITYGMFTAKTRAEKNTVFIRKNVINYIPQTLGILRDIFEFISLGKLPKQMEVVIDDIAEVLNIVDVQKLLKDYYKQAKGSDPIIHFYETFLSKYNPKTREKRGVYYTPEPVVQYIVRSVNSILKTYFNLPEGLANQTVKLLDPAGGTLTFPAEAIKLAAQEYINNYGEGGINKWFANHVLQNFYAFEIMMAPYAIGHLKIGFILNNFGYKLSENQRFKLYLTNTLETEELEQTNIPGLSSLSEENYSANQIKNKENILVIMGNPPYSGISANINKWTERLLKTDIDGTQSYYKVDGQPLDERKIWLQDDYVKFLRFAQWKIQKSGKGIVAMITNHSYLDNPTFRGMRQSLMKTFDEIYIIDLHGNSNKKETSPDGSKDENVFDIRQGVAIVIFIKNNKQKHTKIYHSDLFGLRDKKNKWLSENKFIKKNYTKIKPTSPWYFFIPRETKNIKHYLKWDSVKDIFPVNNVGIVTARDKFAIDYEKNALKNRIRQFRNLSIEDTLIRESYKLRDTTTFKLNKFRKRLEKINNWEKAIKKIAYRPFDIRYIYYSRWIIERPIKTMRNMLQDNIGLITVRQVAEGVFNHCFITENIVESRITLSNKGTAYLFPLFLYPESDLLNGDKPKKQPNIAPSILKKLTKNFGIQPKPEEIFYYIYGFLFSNTYRKTYAEYLKIDYPRIMFTSDNKLFGKLSKFGKQLADLHLLKSPLLNKTTAKFQGKSTNNKVEKIIYKEKEQRVYINKEKYFENISLQVWNYYIGGYKVLHKYLKSRKGRILEKPEHYIKIISALKHTINIQKEIAEIWEHLFVQKK